MNSNTIMISVYKTSLTEGDLEVLKTVLNSLPKIAKWSTDLEDCDNILRIESKYAIEQDIISILQAHSISCVELE